MSEKKKLSEMNEAEKAQLLSEVQNTMRNDLTNMLEQLKEAQELAIKFEKKIKESDFAGKEVEHEIHAHYSLYKSEREVEQLNEAIEAATKATTAVDTYEDYLPYARDVIYALSDIPGVIENYEGESEDRWQLYGKGFLDGQLSIIRK